MASGVPGAGKKYGAVYGCVRNGGSGFFKGNDIDPVEFLPFNLSFGEANVRHALKDEETERVCLLKTLWAFETSPRLDRSRCSSVAGIGEAGA